MDNNIQGLLMFATGALLGASVAATVLHYKYQKDLEREVDSVIEEFSKNPRVIFKDKKDEVNVDVKAEDVATVNQALDDIHVVEGFYFSPENECADNTTGVKKLYNIHGDEIYVNEDGVCEEMYDGDELPPLTEEDVFVYEEPRAIDPEEFAALIEDGYDISYWSLYQGSNGVKILTDDNDEMVDAEQKNATVGNAINIGEYEKDVAYVCNDRLRCVIEITEDLRNYADVMKAMPYLNQ